MENVTDLLLVVLLIVWTTVLPIIGLLYLFGLLA